MQFEGKKNPFVPKLNGWALLGTPLQVPSALGSVSAHHPNPSKRKSGAVGRLVGKSSVGSTFSRVLSVPSPEQSVWQWLL